MVSGIGKMMAHALAENGAAKVYIIGRREDRLKEAASAYPKYGAFRDIGRQYTNISGPQNASC
jgi:NADP-dependent 3-hydroxy acid dehydrogenase YdfG